MLSPVLSFTSEPTPSPPILRYLLSLMFWLLSSYLLCSVLFIPVFLFCPTLSYYHAIDNHVVPYPSCSCIMCWLNLMFVWSLLPRTLVSVPAPPPYLRTPPVFKPVVSISTNQSDYYVTFPYVLHSLSLFVFSLSSYYVLNSLRIILLLSDLRQTPASDLCLKL